MAEQKTLTRTQIIASLDATTKKVQNEIATFCKEGSLNLPADYSYGNALRQAQLKIQDDDKLLACSQASIAKCLLDMVVLGLNISKQQAYIIPYGGQAQLSVSYFGKIAIAKRIDHTIKDIFARCVKVGDEFDFDDDLEGNTTILKHKRTLASLKSKEIEACYATIVYNDGKPSKSLIFDFDRIKQSWKQSQMKPVNDDGTIKKGTTHDKFTEEMCCRTVINAICKPIINASSDADLFGATIQSVDLNEKAAQSDAKAKEKMCSGDIVDVEFSDVDFEKEEKIPEDKIDFETGEIFA